MTEAIGEITGMEAGCVVVKLVNGATILCRGVKKLHRELGCFSVRIGQRVKVQLQSDPANSISKKPFIVEILDIRQ